ncbi:MAG TPA: hypothetical protein DCY59_10015 [Micrococcaceae bacterium]|nr:hypothetical protein [Micrococcaceae bacterium]
MQIKVKIDGWTHACCGSAFSTGDTVEWVMAQLRSPRGEVRFELDDHDQLRDSDVPVNSVRARIVSIELVDRDYVPAIGDPRQMIASEAPARIMEVTHVHAGTDFDHDSIIVSLEVLDRASLPPVHEWNPQTAADVPDEFEQLQSIRIAMYQKSELRQQLANLLERLARTYETVASVRFDQLGNASLVPVNEAAAAVHWHLEFATDKPRIIADIAKAEWEFELDEQHIDLLGQIIDAAAQGHITDRRRGWRMKAMSMEMVIELDSGQQLKQRQKIEGYFGKGNFGIVGAMGDRMTHANHRYAPWR